MKRDSPRSAWAARRPTGPSTTERPRAPAAAARRSVVCGSTVLISMRICPGRPLARMPSALSTVASTSTELGSIVITTSLACATPAAPLAARAPSDSNTLTGSGLTSYTTISNPFLRRFDAIGRPIRPSPMNPILSISWSFSPDGRLSSVHGQAQMGAEAVLQMHGVARRHRARQVLGLHLQQEEARSVGRLMQGEARRFDTGHVIDPARIDEAAGGGNPGEIDAASGVALLHAGLAEVAVVDDGYHQVLGLGDRDGREAAETHQLLAVAGDDEDGAVGSRLGDAKADEGRRAHRAPEVVVGVRVSGGMNIVAGRAEPGDDEKVAAIPEERRDGGAPVERMGLLCHGAHHFFAPIMRCEI